MYVFQLGTIYLLYAVHTIVNMHEIVLVLYSVSML